MGKWHRKLVSCFVFGMLPATIQAREVSNEMVDNHRRLVLALPKTDINLDPAHLEDFVSMAVDLQIHRGLFRYTPSGDVMPDLVREWKVSADRKTYTFFLKESTFSDGTPITARNVHASFARLFAMQASISADLSNIAGGREFAKSKNPADLGIRVVDQRVVQFTLAQPSSLFLKQIAAVDCAVIAVTAHDDIYRPDAKVPTSGPYKIELFEPHRVVLRKWRVDTLDSKLPPELVDFTTSEDDVVKLALAGNTDTLDKQYVPEQSASLLKKMGWTTWVTDLNIERMAILNPKFFDLGTRQAMASIINRDEILTRIKQATGNTLVPAYGLVPKGLPGALSEGRVPSSPERKLKIKNVSPFPLYYSENPIDKEIARTLAESWASIGLSVTPTPLVRSQYLQLLLSKKAEVILGVKGLDYFDAYSILSYFRHDLPGNVFHVSHKQVDELLDLAVTMEDVHLRTDTYKKIQHLILGHVTVVPLTFGSDASGLWSPKVTFVPAHPGGIHTLPLETIEMLEAKNRVR